MTALVISYLCIQSIKSISSRYNKIWKCSLYVLKERGFRRQGIRSPIAISHSICDFLLCIVSKTAFQMYCGILNTPLRTLINAGDLVGLTPGIHVVSINSFKSGKLIFSFQRKKKMCKSDNLKYRKLARVSNTFRVQIGTRVNLSVSRSPFALSIACNSMQRSGPMLSHPPIWSSTLGAI